MVNYPHSSDSKSSTKISSSRPSTSVKGKRFKFKVQGTKTNHDDIHDKENTDANNADDAIKFFDVVSHSMMMKMMLLMPCKMVR